MLLTYVNRNDCILSRMTSTASSSSARASERLRVRKPASLPRCAPLTKRYADSVDDADVSDQVLEDYHQTNQKSTFLRNLGNSQILALAQKAQEEFLSESSNGQAETEGTLRVCRLFLFSVPRLSALTLLSTRCRMSCLLELLVAFKSYAWKTYSLTQKAKDVPPSFKSGTLINLHGASSRKMETISSPISHQLNLHLGAVLKNRGKSFCARIAIRPGND